MTDLEKLLILLLYLTVTSAMKEFSLARYSSTAVYANNSAINIFLVGEGFEGVQVTNGGALECHTDDTTCCRGIDNPDGPPGRGEWYYPNGTVVPPPLGGSTGFYRTRGHMVIRLNHPRGPLPPTGVYRCEIPGAGGFTIIRYITMMSTSSCNDLPDITNGIITYTPPHQVFATLPAGQRYTGTIATHSCSPGYQLVGGSSLRACRSDGIWNGTGPSCTSRQAEFSLARFSSIAVYANTSVIDILLVGEGYPGITQTDGGALECHTDDTTCCRGIDNPNGTGRGEWYYPDGTVVQSPVHFSSTRFYRTRDHMVIRLNRVGGLPLPQTGVYRCEIPGAGGVTITRYITMNTRDILCDDLLDIPNGTIAYTPPRWVSALLPAGQRYTGTIATYSCSSGYQLVGGSSLRACGPDGTWNGTEPSCVPSAVITTTVAALDCGFLTNPDNGQVDTSSGTAFGSTATYTCDTGYTLSGSQSRTCEADGHWKPSEPLCQIVDCGPLTDSEDGRVDTPNGTTFGSTATYTCFTESGSRTCRADGVWTTLDSSCQKLILSSAGASADDDSSSGISAIVAVSVIAMIWFVVSMVIIVFLIVYNKNLRKQLNQQVDNFKREGPYESMGGAPECEVTGVVYEEIDKMKESKKQPPAGDYELTQCDAYGPWPVNRDTS